MIFPHRLLVAAPHALVHGLVVRAYDLHAEAHRQVEDQFGPDWLMRGHWSAFASLWCSGIPLLVGKVVRHGELLFMADRRVWEAHRVLEGSGKGWAGAGSGSYRYKHYISDSRVHLRSTSRSSGGAGEGGEEGGGNEGDVMEIQAVDESLSLADVCVESALDDDSSLWSCKFHTVVEDAAGRVVLTLDREGFLETDAMSHAHLEWTVLVTVSRGFVELFDNWLRWYRRLELGMRVVLAAEDDETFQRYRGCADLELLVGNFQDQNTSLDYNNREYRDLVSNRAGYLISLIETHQHIIYSDVDTVWLRDPRPFFTGAHDAWMALDEKEPVVETLT